MFALFEFDTIGLVYGILSYNGQAQTQILTHCLDMSSPKMSRHNLRKWYMLLTASY